MAQLVVFLAAAAGVVMLAPVAPFAAESMQLSVEGQLRTVLLERPAAPGPRPTIIMLHGALVSPAQEGLETGLARAGPRDGFVVAFPEGRGLRWNFFPSGQVPAQEVAFFQPHGGVPDDVSFIKLLVDELVKRGIADRNRVYLAGRSLGGVMTLRLACHDAEPFAALGLVVSTMADVIGANCRISKSLPLVMLSGTADPVLPYAGGRSRRGDLLWPAERVVRFFRDLNGCTEPAETSVMAGQRPQPIEIEHSTKCRSGAVLFYRVVGGGHAVPTSMNASKMLVDFFSDKVRDEGVSIVRLPRVPPGSRLCRGEEGAKSPKENASPVVLNFTNRHGSPVKIYWLDFGGKRTPYRTLTDGQSYSQPTFSGHIWIAADEMENCLGIYISSASQNEITVR
jgi:polyhydroxybutyrate depolymerase